MGINFHIKEYQCKARWSYTGFKRFREKIGQSVGLIIERDINHRILEQDWNKWDRDWFIFLTHSDCDGHLTSSQCGRIAKKLKSVIEKWPTNDIVESYDVEQAKSLIEAMEHCKDKKKKMEFS
jgi:hypothetical protein